MPITYDAPKLVAIGTSTTVVSAANKARKRIVLINNESNDIFLGFGTAAVLDKGIKIAGGEEQVFEKFSITTQAINAIARTGETDLLVQEANS